MTSIITQWVKLMINIRTQATQIMISIRTQATQLMISIRTQATKLTTSIHTQLTKPMTNIITHLAKASIITPPTDTNINTIPSNAIRDFKKTLKVTTRSLLIFMLVHAIPLLLRGAQRLSYNIPLLPYHQ